MKSIILGIQLIFVVFVTIAQGDTPVLPLDSDTHKIIYSDVVSIDSVSKDELYSRGLEWFALTYKSSKSVIQMEDRESGKIVGKALMKVYHKAMGSSYPSGYINYTISIQFKDGRYKYTIDNFYHSGEGTQVASFGSCDDMINTTKKGFGFSYQKMFNYYLLQLDANTKELIAGMKFSMNNKSTLKSNTDW